MKCQESSTNVSVSGFRIIRRHSLKQPRYLEDKEVSKIETVGRSFESFPTLRASEGFYRYFGLAVLSTMVLSAT